MRFINKIFQPEQPFTPMNFTRRPVLHLFWAGGVVAMVLGFSIGFLLWMAQTGFLDIIDDYQTLKLWHARIQIIGFTGSFLLGFALQAGPHVLGGHPPPFVSSVSIIPALWLGLVLGEFQSSFISVIGNLLISLAFLHPSYLLLKISLEGDPQWRFSRGIPMAGGFLLMASSPWLDLVDPEKALFILWCGPITIAMVAGQQLINNVIKGGKIVGKSGLAFLALLTTAWLTTALATFTQILPWNIAGIEWLLVLAMLAWKTNLFPALTKFGFAAISLTLFLGFIGMIVAASVMAIGNDVMPVDAVVHILGAGVTTVLIIGVVSRVVGFFSGGAVLSDLAVSVTLLIWSAIATLRAATTVSGVLSLTASVIGGILLVVWGTRVAWRLYEIGRRPYQDNSA
ncbi:MAG: hypothetical protein HW380_3961 [Magnetococcales bacterium]|nr:hypothetical protein [Magnetococcales bacterium]